MKALMSASFIGFWSCSCGGGFGCICAYHGSKQTFLQVIKDDALPLNADINNWKIKEKILEDKKWKETPTRPRSASLLTLKKLLEDKNWSRNGRHLKNWCALKYKEIYKSIFFEKTQELEEVKKWCVLTYRELIEDDGFGAKMEGTEEKKLSKEEREWCNSNKTRGFQKPNNPIWKKMQELCVAHIRNQLSKKLK